MLVDGNTLVFASGSSGAAPFHVAAARNLLHPSNKLAPPKHPTPTGYVLRELCEWRLRFVPWMRSGRQYHIVPVPMYRSSLVSSLLVEGGRVTSSVHLTT